MSTLLSNISLTTRHPVSKFSTCIQCQGWGQFLFINSIPIPLILLHLLEGTSMNARVGVNSGIGIGLNSNSFLRNWNWIGIEIQRNWNWIEIQRNWNWIDTFSERNWEELKLYFPKIFINIWCWEGKVLTMSTQLIPIVLMSLGGLTSNNNRGSSTAGCISC